MIMTKMTARVQRRVLRTVKRVMSKTLKNQVVYEGDVDNGYHDSLALYQYLKHGIVGHVKRVNQEKWESEVEDLIESLWEFSDRQDYTESFANDLVRIASPVFNN